MDFRFGLENFKPENPGMRFGIVTNTTGVTQDLEQNVDILKRNGVRILKIFSPEHGFYGSFANGEAVPDQYYRGIPVKSLYREESRELDGTELDGLDAIIFDIQDAGVRFYTYLSTLHNVMEACQKKSVRLFVLDRPNPINSVTVNGPMLEKHFLSFVGTDQMPIRYGMTVGELSSFFDRKFGLEPEVVRMSGYRRGAYYDELVKTYIPLSWNLPSLDSVLNYAGMCLLESINVSVGRGTPYPFSVIGFPKLWSIINGTYPGIRLKRMEFSSLLDPHKGMSLQGYRVHITERDSYDPVAVWAGILYELIKSGECKLRENWVRLLYGSNELAEAAGNQVPFSELQGTWKEDARDFMEIRSQHLLY